MEGEVRGPPSLIILQIDHRPARVSDLNDLDILRLYRDEFEVLASLKEQRLIVGEVVKQDGGSRDGFSENPPETSEGHRGSGTELGPADPR